MSLGLGDEISRQLKEAAKRYSQAQREGTTEGNSNHFLPKGGLDEAIE